MLKIEAFILAVHSLRSICNFAMVFATDKRNGFSSNIVAVIFAASPRLGVFTRFQRATSRQATFPFIFICFAVFHVFSLHFWTSPITWLPYHADLRWILPVVSSCLMSLIRKPILHVIYFIRIENSKSSFLNDICFLFPSFSGMITIAFVSLSPNLYWQLRNFLLEVERNLCHKKGIYFMEQINFCNQRRLSNYFKK